MIRVTIYSRPGCHLCDEMKTLVQRIAISIPLSLDEVDVSADSALEARYGLEIPVLMIEGKKVAKFRVTEEQLTRMLTARTGGTGKTGGTGG